MRAMALHWMPKLVHRARLADAELTSSIVEMMARKSPEILAAQIKALLGRADATPVARSIRCPTLILTGRSDKVGPPSVHREMAALIPRSKLVIVEDCGHMAPMERPERVTSAMVEWLESVDAS
jgi:pimeloyl-ACP methyl ester carboxylesterase